MGCYIVYRMKEWVQKKEENYHGYVKKMRERETLPVIDINDWKMIKTASFPLFVT